MKGVMNSEVLAPDRTTRSPPGRFPPKSLVVRFGARGHEGMHWVYSACSDRSGGLGIAAKDEQTRLKIV